MPTTPFVRPPSEDIDFARVIRRSDLSRKVTRLHWVATGLACLALVVYLLAGSTACSASWRCRPASPWPPSACASGCTARPSPASSAERAARRRCHLFPRTSGGSQACYATALIPQTP